MPLIQNYAGQLKWSWEAFRPSVFMPEEKKKWKLIRTIELEKEAAGKGIVE